MLKRILIIFIFINLFLVGFRIIAFATESQEGSGNVTELKPPIEGDTGDLVGFVTAAISRLLGYVGAIALVIFIYGGFKFLFSFGDPTKVKEGMEAMKWAVFGMVAIFFAYAAIGFIFEIIGVNK